MVWGAYQIMRISYDDIVPPPRQVELEHIPEPTFERRKRPRRSLEATRQEPEPEVDFHHLSRRMDVLHEEHHTILRA